MRRTVRQKLMTTITATVAFTLLLALLLTLWVLAGIGLDEIRRRDEETRW